METVSHLFMPGHTIGAVMRLYNGHNLSVQQYEELLQEFKAINPASNPRPGERWLVPIHPIQALGGR